MKLKRYWFSFKLNITDPHPLGILLGVGITAFDYQEALGLLRQKVFKSDSLPEIENTIEDVDINKLDLAHLSGNMSNPSIRGVWFPLGYQ